MSYSWHRAEDSYCCKDCDVTYCWVQGTTLKGQAAIEAVAERVVELLADLNWGLNVYELWGAGSHVEALLERASQGQLRALDEIKAIDRPAMERLFEIRHEVELLKKTRMMGRVVDSEYKSKLVRIYHAELSRHLPWHALGLHVHLKTIGQTDDETVALQNAEIDRAIEVLDEGRDTQWGV